MGNVIAKNPDYWNLPQHPPVTNTKWMSRLPDNQNLFWTSIPGTHDTMSRNSVIPFAWCQAWSLNEQMDAGIRFFDIRCRHFRNGLPIYHGPVDMNCNLNYCVTEMVRFLDSNPLEVLIMRVKEEYEAAENTNMFADAVKEIIPGRRPDRFWMNNSIPTVGEARGKIIILQNFSCSPPMGVNYDELNTEDSWKLSSVSKKWPKVKQHLQSAKASIEEGKTKMFLTFSSYSGSATLPSENARSMNPKLYKFVRDNKGPFGIIAMDYPGPTLVQDIIEGNF